MKLLLAVCLLTGCTIHIIDDTSDYDVSGSMKSNDCEIYIERKEVKTSGTKKVKIK